MKYYDYIIIGSGIAGLYTALLAKETGSVLIITKGSIEDCNTRYAQGGIAAPLSKLDSPLLHLQDTLMAGDGLCDPEAVQILTTEAMDRIADLIKFGVNFDTVNGEIALTREAAHSISRVLHAGGDATGAHIESTLSNQVRKSSIIVMENCLCTQIILDNMRVNGTRVLDCHTGKIEEYQCKFIILATGGAGRIFKYTTNSDVATGDGNALAFQAGAEVTDMEFFQFHPTALRLPGIHPFLISEAVRGEGGKLRDIQGYCFMSDYAKEAELAPRDIVARSIHSQMIKTGSDHVFLDVTHLPSSLITTRFPNIYRFCMDHGLDISKDFIPVAPAAHYFMGGVKVNIWGETNIEGLFAAGETSCTGVHGANRLASNSLLEVLVYGKRIIDRANQTTRIASDQLKKLKSEYRFLTHHKTKANVPQLNLSNVQSLLWDKVGIMRTGEQLVKAAETLFTWQQLMPVATDRPSYELSNLLLNARLITESALIREESRGAHFRMDYPDSSPEWEKHIIFKIGDAK